jgi:hypothetical protein
MVQESDHAATAADFLISRENQLDRAPLKEVRFRKRMERANKTSHAPFHIADASTEDAISFLGEFEGGGFPPVASRYHVDMPRQDQPSVRRGVPESGEQALQAVVRRSLHAYRQGPDLLSDDVKTAADGRTALDRWLSRQTSKQVQCLIEACRRQLAEPVELIGR